MVQENRRAGVTQAANTYFGLPKCGLEFPPIPFVRTLNVVVTLHESLEDEVFDKIGCCELGTSRVQRFEDLLGILVRTEIDNYHLKKLARDSLDCGRTGVKP